MIRLVFFPLGHGPRATHEYVYNITLCNDLVCEYKTPEFMLR